MINLYILSNILFGYAIRSQRIKFTNIFIFIYWGFMLLYPMVIYYAHGYYKSYSGLNELTRLIGDRTIVNIVLRTASIGLITFSTLLFIRPIKKESQKTFRHYSIKGYQILYFLLFPIALYLNSITNWTTDGRGFLPSIAAYSRNLITVLTIILVLPQNVSIKKKALFIFLFMIITFTSTQRTNALIVIIAAIYTLKSSKLAFKIFSIGILSLLVLGSIRNQVDPTNLLYPIIGEGMLGSWGLLQAIDVENSSNYSWGQFFMLFNELINWIFQIIHIPITLPTLGDIVTKTGVVYYPMGGFFYLSDAYLMNPYLGPIIYTSLIYFIYRMCINKYYTSHTSLSLICLSLLFEAIKATFCVFIVMILFNVICYYLVILIVRHKRKYFLRNNRIRSTNKRNNSLNMQIIEN